MNREEIIRMAREAGCVEASHPFNPWSVSQEALERFAALVAAAEREACADVVEHMGIEKYKTLTIAAAIRAGAAIQVRGEK